MEVWWPDAAGSFIEDANWYPPTPQISVGMTETQIGPDICIRGKNFTPNAEVTFRYDNMPGQQGPYDAGFVSAGSDQAFIFKDTSQEGGLVQCSDSQLLQQVSVFARDTGSGKTVSTTVPGAYWCTNGFVGTDYNGGCH
jgi:hypothetical protein